MKTLKEKSEDRKCIHGKSMYDEDCYECEKLVKCLPEEDTLSKITPSEQIREIWDEMKELKRLREDNVISDWGERGILLKKYEEKYEDIEILFGHESILSKAIIYYLSN